MKFTFVARCLPLLIGVGGCWKANDAAGPAPLSAETGQAVVAPGSPQAESVTVETPRPPVPDNLTCNGRLVWDDNATVRLFTSLAGRVEKITAEVGDNVRPSDPLALIHSPDYGQIQADARRAGTDLAQMERSLWRVKELFNHGAAAEKDVQAAEADARRAQIEKRRAEERLALYGAAEQGASPCYCLKSPIAGTVVEKNISPGSELRSDQMLANIPQVAAPQFVITDPARLWIQIDVPERDQGRIRVGQSFSVSSVSLPGLSFTGKVDVVAASLDPETRTVKVRGSLANNGRLLKAEMFVKVIFLLEPGPGVEVSSRAVFLKGDRHYVMVEAGPGRYVRQEVAVGNERADRIIVTRGLEPGRRVVVGGALLLEQMVDS